jgi:hypothetical protein
MLLHYYDYTNYLTLRQHTLHDTVVLIVLHFFLWRSDPTQAIPTNYRGF